MGKAWVIPYGLSLLTSLCWHLLVSAHLLVFNHHPSTGILASQYESLLDSLSVGLHLESLRPSHPYFQVQGPFPPNSLLRPLAPCPPCSSLRMGALSAGSVSFWGRGYSVRLSELVLLIPLRSYLFSDVLVFFCASTKSLGPSSHLFLDATHQPGGPEVSSRSGALRLGRGGNASACLVSVLATQCYSHKPKYPCSGWSSTLTVHH